MKDENIFKEAIERIAHCIDVETAVDFENRARGTRKARESRRPRQRTSWDDLLQKRQLAEASMDTRKRQAFEKAVELDQQIACRKLFFQTGKSPKETCHPKSSSARSEKLPVLETSQAEHGTTRACLNRMATCKR